MKRANLLDWYYIMIILLLTSLCVYVSYIILNNDRIQQLWTDEGVSDKTEYSRQAILSFDNIMVFVVVGLSVFVLISAALIFNHLALFIISFILLCIAVFISAMVSNSFWAFRSVDVLTATANAFPKINFLMDHLPIYIAFMGIAVLVASFISWRTQQI